MIKKYWPFLAIVILFALFLRYYSSYKITLKEKKDLEDKIKIERIENKKALEETKEINKKLKKEKGELYDKLDKIIQSNKDWGNSFIPDDFYKLLQQ